MRLNQLKNGIKTKWIKNKMDEPLDLSKKRPGPWDKRRIDWFRVFVWLVFMPVFTFFSWYCVYELVMWVLYG